MVSNSKITVASIKDRNIQFSVMFGKQTFSSRSTSGWINVYVAERGDARGFYKVTFAEYKRIIGRAVNNSSVQFPASSDGYAGHGHWYQNMMAYPTEKHHAFLFLGCKDTSNGAIRAQAGIIVHLRSEGPLLRIEMKPCTYHLALFQSVDMFYGRGDVLSPAEAKDYGLILPPMTIANYFNDEELDEMFTVTEEGPELVTKPEFCVVENSRGMERKVLLPRPRSRKLTIRR